MEHFCALAPSEFTLASRNPAEAVRMGGRVVNFCTANGAPDASDRARGGATATTPRCARSSGSTTRWGRSVSGFQVVEPTDISVALKPVHMAYPHTASGDLVWAARGIERQAVGDTPRMVSLSRRITQEELGERLSFHVVTDNNSPRRLDEELLEGAMTAAGRCR